MPMHEKVSLTSCTVEMAVELLTAYKKYLVSQNVIGNIVIDFQLVHKLNSASYAKLYLMMVKSLALHKLDQVLHL